jgi:DNA-binding NarL/FixJ family response regulator
MPRRLKRRKRRKESKLGLFIGSKIMAKATILLVDNDISFLNTITVLLQNQGYEVIAARHLQEAKQKLQFERTDLAIIDLRLESDSDEKDLSGLELASELPANLPKIILTGLANYNTAREALRGNIEGKVITAELIAKADGPSTLLATIKRLLKTSLSYDSSSDTLLSRRTEESILPSDRAILELLLNGLSDRQIAKRIDLSEDTVAQRIYRMQRALGTKSRDELVAWAPRILAHEALSGNSTTDAPPPEAKKKKPKMK